METDQLIAIDLFCTNYNVEYSFVQSLGEAGLIDTVIIQETKYIHVPQLQKLESIIRLHDDLEINLEGIEVVPADRGGVGLSGQHGRDALA